MVIEEISVSKGSMFHATGTSSELFALEFFLPRLWKNKYGLLFLFESNDKENCLCIVISRKVDILKIRNLLQDIKSK